MNDTSLIVRAAEAALRSKNIMLNASARQTVDVIGFIFLSDPRVFLFVPGVTFAMNVPQRIARVSMHVYVYACTFLSRMQMRMQQRLITIRTGSVAETWISDARIWRLGFVALEFRNLTSLIRSAKNRNMTAYFRRFVQSYQWCWKSADTHIYTDVTHACHARTIVRWHERRERHP